MSVIKPIETIYNGYRFRSRLEARWAVFFDAAHINYEYEPEGYVLYDGTYYLPDFYLPDYELFVEIKPFDKTIVKYVGDGNEWEQKCAKFRDSTSKAILLMYGDPCTDIYKLLFAWDTCDSSGGSSEYKCKFVETGNKIVVAIPFQRADREIFVTDFDSLISNTMVGTTHEFNICDEELFRLYDPRGSDLLNIAKTKSRQVRFEHNEKKY